MICNIQLDPVAKVTSTFTLAPSPFGALGNAAPAQKSADGAPPAPPASGLFGALGAAPSNKDPAKDANAKGVPLVAFCYKVYLLSLHFRIAAETSSAAPATGNLFGGMGLGKASGTSAPGTGAFWLRAYMTIMTTSELLCY